MFQKVWQVISTGAVHVWNQLKNSNVFPAITVFIHTVIGAAVGALTPAAQTLAAGFLSGHPATLSTVILSLANAGVPAAVSAALGFLYSLASHSPIHPIAQLAESVPPDQVNNAAAYIDTAILTEVKKLNPPTPPPSAPAVTAAPVNPTPTAAAPLADKVQARPILNPGPAPAVNPPAPKPSWMGNVEPQKVLFLGILLASLLAGSSVSAQSIYHYNGGLSLTKQTVTNPITGDFLALGVGAGVIPLTFKNGVLSWDAATPIETIDYLFVRGVATAEGTGVGLTPWWWLGPIFGAGEFSQSGNIDLAHAVVGGTEGINLGLFTLSAAEVVDLSNGNFYLGPAVNFQFDAGGFSLVQVH